MADFRQNIGTHFVNDRHNLYFYVRDSRIPHGSFDNPRRLTQDGSIYLVCIVIAAALLIAWGVAA